MTGVYAPPLVPVGQHVLAEHVPQRHSARPERALVDAARGAPGSLTDTQPVALPTRTGAGRRAATFFDDYYNRIHLLPTSIDLGAMANTTGREVTLWNAYATPVSVVEHSAGQDGVAIRDLTTPRPLLPLQSVSFTAHVGDNGPATINAAFAFTFSTPDTLRLTVKGTRARLWPFRPNWREPVAVTAEYRTDIITSRSGEEQRRALRQSPRRAISYTITVARGERQRFMQLIARWQSRPIAMPDPTRRLRLSVGSPAEGGVLNLCACGAALPPWMAADQQILIDGKLVTVTDIDGDIVTFEPANPEPLRPGTEIRPVLTGRLTGTVGAEHPVSRAAEARITFSIDPGTETFDEGEAGLYVHGGREVMTRRPNWASGISQAFDWPIEQVDFGRGRTATYTPVEQGWFTQSASYLGIGPEDIAEFEAFFYRMRGRQGEFHMPTGVHDMEVAADLDADTAFLRVAGTDIYDNFNDDPSYRAIALRLRDGRLLLRSIQAMHPGDDATVLELTQPWLISVPADEIVMASWMPVFRFSADDLSFEWPTDRVAQVQLALRSLPDSQADDPLPTFDGAAQWVLEVWGPSGAAVFDRFDWMINVRYPAIFFHALAWVMINETVIDQFDKLVSFEYPDIFHDISWEERADPCECAA